LRLDRVFLAKALRDGADPASLPGLPPKELVDRVTRAADYDGWTAAFLEKTGRAD